MNSHRLKIQLLCVCSLLLASAVHASSEEKFDIIIRKIRMHRISQLTNLGLALYILNDKDPNGIATDAKQAVRDFASETKDVISTTVSDGMNQMRKLIEESMPQKKDEGSSKAVPVDVEPEQKPNDN